MGLSLRLANPIKLFIILASLFSLWTACENELDQSKNILPTPQTEQDAMTTGMDAMVNNTADMMVGGACATCPEIGSWYRFTKLQLDSIDRGPHPVISILNSLWSADVDSHALNILFEIKAVEGDQITVGAMNAAWLSEAENDYCILPETAIEFIFTQNNCTISNQQSAGINIYAGSQEIPKNCSPTGEALNAIPVRDVLLATEFTSDCGQLVNGVVQSAAIKKVALEETCSCLSPVIASCEGIDSNFEGNNFGECAGCNTRYSSLSRRLNSIQQLNWECEVDGEQAVCIGASFEANRLDFTPPVCD